jgi:MFS family permease
MTNIIHYRWIILGLVLFCQLSQAVAYQCIPPILGILVLSLKLSYTQAGGLMSLYSLPRVILGIPGGVLVDRYGAKKVGGACLLTLSLGTLLVALGSDYWVLGTGRLLMGIGATFLIVVTLHVVTFWFRDKEMGLAMGFFHTAMPLGTILSLNFVGVSAAHIGWRETISAVFVIASIAFVLFLLLHRDRDLGAKVPSGSLHLFRMLKETGWGIWLVGSTWAFLNAAIIPYFTYAPDYFFSKGKDVIEAGLLASYPMWASVLLAPIVGLWIDRMGRKRLLIFLGFLFSAFLYYYIPRFPQHAAIFAILIGIWGAIQPTAIFSVAAERLPASHMGLGFGIIGTTGALGMVIGPYISGSLRDFTGDYMWSFNAMAILSALGMIPTLFIRKQSEK